MTYHVQLIKSDEGWAVGCLELPGCWSQGNSRQEAIENIKDAIHDYLLTLTEQVGQEATEVTEIEVPT